MCLKPTQTPSRRSLLRWFLTIFAGLVILWTLISLGEAKEITDMFGRRFVVPDRATRVYSPSPVVTYMLYTIDPAMLVGLNFPIREHEKRYLHSRMLDLPVVGGWFGQGQTPNLEKCLCT